LEKEVRKLGELAEQDLQKQAQTARLERNKIETKRDEMTKQRYWVT
jgi:hypothetical protein